MPHNLNDGSARPPRLKIYLNLGTLVEYYLCGPPVLIQAAVVDLKGLGVPPHQIAFDEF